MTDITYVKLASNGNSTSTHSKLVISSIICTSLLSLWPFSSKFWKILTVIINISWKQDFTATKVVYHRDQWTRSRTHRLPIHLWHSCHPVILSSCHHLIEHFTAFTVSNRQSYLREHIQYYFFTTPPIFWMLGRYCCGLARLFLFSSNDVVIKAAVFG